MVHIINITQARNSLASLVKQVAQTKQPVVIVRESIPSAILYPYNPNGEENTQDYQEKLLTVKGDWFSEKEQKEIRDEVEKRLKT